MAQKNNQKRKFKSLSVCEHHPGFFSELYSGTLFLFLTELLKYKPYFFPKAKSRFIVEQQYL